MKQRGFLARGYHFLYAEVAKPGMDNKPKNEAIKKARKGDHT